jgi:outer membrane protein TolC
MVSRYSRQCTRLLFLLSAIGLILGCSAKHYRRSADSEVYGILRDYEKHIFGHTNEFSIDTRYSDREPKSILPGEIIQDRTSTNLRVINLEDALRLAVKYSRDYQNEKEQLYLTALNLTGNLYEFGPQFFANTEGRIDGVGDEQSTGSINSQVGVSKLLKTGGRLSIALGNDLVRYFTGYSGNEDSRSTAINLLSVNITQPLLRGFGVNDPTVESLTQAERNVVYAIRDFARYQQQFAVDTADAYFALLTQKDIVRNNYRNFTNRVETTRYLEARAVDRERKSDVDDARTAELTARRDYINSLAGYLDVLDSFKLRLGLPISERVYLDDADLKNLIQAGLVPVDIRREAAFALCLTNQMDVLNAVDRFEDSKRKIRVAADQLRAQLDFVSTVRLDSEAPDDYTNFDPNKVRYSVGLQLDLPVDRLRERNTYRATLVSFESQIRSLSLTLDNYKDRIDRGLRTLEQARLNILNGQESLRVAERRVDNNAMLLETGRATIRDLREAQDSLIEAENRLATLYTVYTVARLQLLVNMGMLDTRPERFWLADPLKEKLTPEQLGDPPLKMPDDHVLPPETFLEPTT